MKLATVALILGMFFFSCSSNKQNASTMTPDNGKALLLDGTWEANYIMNSPKPFAELYPQVKPTITFNSADKRVSGISGCNNFNGGFTVEGNKLSFSEGMALTRKMCPDMAGEETFMTTLQKVNSYSISEQGKTLNLIMGDMAVMRMQRK